VWGHEETNMGLDCTAYEKVELIEAISLEEMQKLNWQHPKYDEDKCLFLFNVSGFEEQSDGLVEGIYKQSGKSFGFRAGSYSGYNAYRARLAELVGTTDRAVWNDPKPGPFMEQINFSDCEGFLGPKTCAKLLVDYTEHEAEAKKGMEYWFDSYKEWMEALEIAAKGGVITFH
jgi:hypothetical protein